MIEILAIFNLLIREDFKNYFLLYSSLFISGIIIGMVVGLKFSKLSDGILYLVKNYTTLRFGFKGFKSILANNFLVSLAIMYLFSLTRLDDFKIFIAKFYFIWMGLILGVAISKIALKYNFLIALSLVVPHGIVEIPTVIFAISFGWILSELKDITSIFITASLIIFILMSISAYIETFITLKIFYKLKRHYKLKGELDE